MAQSHDPTSVDHLTLAKEYIEKGDDFYGKAADEIIAAISAHRQETGEELSHAEIGNRIGRSKTWVGNLVRSRTSDQRADQPLIVDWQSGSNKRDAVAQKAMRDPKQRKQTLAQMDDDELGGVVEDAMQTRLERARTRKQEHMPPLHEQKANRAAHEEEMAPAQRAMGSALSPQSWLEQALRTVRLIREMDGSWDDYDACLKIHLDIATEMWEFGAMRGFDVSRIAEAMRRFEDES